MKKNLLSFVRNNKWWVIGGVVALAIGIIVGRPTPFLEGFETYVAKVATLTQEVRATGKVAPIERSALAFEKVGTVSQIFVTEGSLVKRGDTLVSLDSGTLVAELNASQARLATEQARLAELVRGTRQESLQVSETKVKNAERALSDARNAYFNKFRDAYVSTYDAIINNSDSLFNNAISANPTMAIRVRNNEVKRDIEKRRIIIGETLTAWNSSLSNISEETNTEEYSKNIRLYITIVKDFLSQLQQVTQELTTANSALSEEQITEYRRGVIVALDKVSGALQDVISAEKVLSAAVADIGMTYRQLNIDIAGSSIEELRAQQARVAEAEAVVAGSQIALTKSSIVSPIDGVVINVAPKIGESVSVGAPAVTVMSSGSFKVEVQIPEVDIAKVKNGDTGIVTLDAYGSDIKFPVSVSKIDPAETIVGGIPTYKVTLVFTQVDERIRSGMTANITLTTGSRENAIAIPFQAVVSKDGIPQVRVVEGEELVYKIVTTGLRSTNGYIEIIEGITAGETVVVYEK